MGCITNKTVKAKQIEKEKLNLIEKKTEEINESKPNININVNLKSKNSIKVRYSIFTQKIKGDFNQFYKILSCIGKGGFGSVYKIFHLPTNQTRAMKIIRKRTLIYQDGDQTFLREIDLLQCADHPNIIKIFEHYDDKVNFYIITELVKGGDLLDTISEWKEFTEEKAAYIIFQLMTAVNYLHTSLKVVHRDIKPENILVEKSEDKNHFNIKLIDFGTGNFLEKNKNFSLCVGTPYYIAPEVLRKDYNEKVDIWSCGVLLYMLLVGYPPFFGKNVKEIFDAVKIGKINMTAPEWQKISDTAKDLLNKMFEYDPGKRISAEETLRHPFLQNVKARINKEAEKKLSIVINNLRNFNVKEKFQQATLAYIVHFLISNSEIEDLQNVFRSLDKNGVGRLSHNDIIEGYEKIFGTNYSNEEIKKIIEGLDQDMNGYIEYEEFLRAALNKKNLISEQNLRRAFDRFDLNNDGKLTISEIKEVFQTDDIDIIKDLLDFVDKNKDGVVSYGEFCEMMKKLVYNSIAESKYTHDSNLISNFLESAIHLNTKEIQNNPRQLNTLMTLDKVYNQWLFGKDVTLYASSPFLTIPNRPVRRSNLQTNGKLQSKDTDSMDKNNFSPQFKPKMLPLDKENNFSPLFKPKLLPIDKEKQSEDN